MPATKRISGIEPGAERRGLQRRRLVRQQGRGEDEEQGDGDHLFTVTDVDRIQIAHT